MLNVAKQAPVNIRLIVNYWPATGCLCAKNRSRCDCLLDRCPENRRRCEVRRSS